MKTRHQTAFIATALCAVAIGLTACVPVKVASGEADAPPVASYQYRCESGLMVAATYPDTDSAIVRYRGKTYDMQIAVSADGARYVGGGLEWWTKGSGAGSTGTLFTHGADGASGQRLEFCTAS